MKAFYADLMEASCYDRWRGPKIGLEYDKKWSQGHTLFFEFDQNSWHRQTLTFPPKNMLVGSAWTGPPASLAPVSVIQSEWLHIIFFKLIRKTFFVFWKNNKKIRNVKDRLIFFKSLFLVILYLQKQWGYKMFITCTVFLACFIFISNSPVARLA